MTCYFCNMDKTDGSEPLGGLGFGKSSDDASQSYSQDGDPQKTRAMREQVAALEDSIESYKWLLSKDFDPKKIINPLQNLLKAIEGKYEEKMKEYYPEKWIFDRAVEFIKQMIDLCQKAIENNYKVDILIA